MGIPTYAQLTNLASTSNGLSAQQQTERILTILAMLASGTAPDGTLLPGPTGSVSNVVSKNTTYTALPGDFVEADISGGSWTLTLPATPPKGTTVGAKIVANAAGNALTVAGTIDGDTNILMIALNVARIFVYDGTAWKVVNQWGQENAVITASGTYTIPKTGIYELVAVGGGSSGGGGGTGHATAQVGGSGGASGSEGRVTQSIAVGTVLTVTIAAAATGGGGGLANGNAGTAGNPGGDTTITGTGVSLTGQGASLGGPGGGASSNTTTLGCGPGQTNNRNLASITAIGQGGLAASNGGLKGGSGLGYAGGGGGGGSNATSLLGGSGGNAGTNNAGGATIVTQTGTLNGGNGGDAAANSGAGGGGGGGGGPVTGVGGTGGKGGSGVAIIRQLS